MFQKIDDTNISSQKYAFHRIMKYYKRIFLYWIAIILTVVVGVGNSISNIILGELVTDLSIVEESNVMEVVREYCIKLGLFYAVFSVVTIIKDIIAGLSGPYFLTDIRTALYKKLMELDISFFDINSTGSLLNKFTSDCTVLNEVYVSKTFMILGGAVQTVSGIIISFIYTWQATLACFVGFIISVFIHFICQKYLQKYWGEYGKSATAANTRAEQVLAAIRTVKSCDKELYEAEAFKKNLDEIESVFTTVSFGIGTKNGLNLFISNSMLVAFLYFMSFIIVNKPNWGLDIGSLQVVNGSITLAGCGLVQCLALIDEFGKAKPSAAKILAVLDTEPLINQKYGEYPDKQLSGKIEFKEVTFHYPTSEQYAVRDLSFTISPGENVAIVGESGCGKSTTLQLLQRFYEIESGEILVDDINIKKLSPHYIRSQISVVPQGPALFSMSLMDNIRYAKPNASENEVKESAEIGNAHDFITSFPDGYHTVVDPFSLSEGQKQRICISRAILTNSPILLLDEATASLDTESERLVQQSLEKVRKGKTSIVVAHRLATVVNADRILVMKDGKVVESGTHSELYAQNGYYTNLIKFQIQ